jgi:hypothetical protein
MNALFPWPIVRVVPRYSTGSNGLPVPMMAAPSVQVLGRHLSLLSRIGEGEHDGPRTAAQHVEDDRLGERPGLAGSAHQNGGLERMHHLGEAVPAALCLRPARDQRRVGRDLALGALEAPTVGEDQAS